jgi:hypothetical protein
MDTKKKLVTGLMTTRIEAENAVSAILAHGYRRDDISVLMSEATRAKHFAIETGTKAPQGAGVGGAVGGAVGAVVAAIAAIGTNLVLPGLGLIIAGPIAAGLAGLGAGGAVGGLVGGLVGAGIPEHEAKIYETGLRSGHILIGVEARTDEDEKALKKILGATGAKDIRSEGMKKASGR